MIHWLLSLFGFKKKEPAPLQERLSASRAQNPAHPSALASVAASPELSEAAREFLTQLVAEAEPVDLQALAPDDRIFLSGILKRIRENKLNIPLLPQAAIEISRLMANPNSHLDDFVRVLESDPALSVEVLRISNSALYGFAEPARSVNQAVLRVGLGQIRGLIIIAHLHGKVLQGTTFQAEAAQLSRLSTTLAQFGQELSPTFGMPRERAFTRGILSQVEKFVIMGTAAEVSSDQKRKIVPSAQGLLQALRQFGPKVRELTAAAWGLEDLLLDRGDGAGPAGAYVWLQRHLVAAWTESEPPPPLEGVETSHVTAALRRIGIR